MMQDAICPKCGDIFRVRAHTKECAAAQHDPTLLDLAVAVYSDYVAQRLRRTVEKNDTQ